MKLNNLMNALIYYLKELRKEDLRKYLLEIIVFVINVLKIIRNK